jgi:GntR family transcriptional regulator
MKSQLALDESSDVPIYQQIINHFEKAILTGNLNPGDFLPSVREFSMKHQVNPNTVSKAYQMIQGLKLVESVRGLGLKVTPIDHRYSDKRKREILISSIDALIDTGMSLQISKEALLQEIKDRMKTHYHPVPIKSGRQVVPHEQ